MPAFKMGKTEGHSYGSHSLDVKATEKQLEKMAKEKEEVAENVPA